MVRRFVHFEVLCTAKYRYGEKYLRRKIKFYLRTGNLPTAYKQLSSNSSRTGKNHRTGPKIFFYIRVANLGDFSPKKTNFRVFYKNVQGIFRPISKPRCGKDSKVGIIGFIGFSQ
jgi:hypothetical protein